MPLKPQNIVQAAEADMKRATRNAEQAAQSKQFAVNYEVYAFHRDHVRRAFNRPHALILMALMDPMVKTKKANTKLLYGNAGLLLEALRLSTDASSQAGASASRDRQETHPAASGSAGSA